MAKAKGKGKGKNKKFIRKHKKAKKADPFGKKVREEKGLVFPMRKNPWPKWIECCLSSSSEYTILNAGVVGGQRGYFTFNVNCTPYQPWNTATLTSGVTLLNQSFSPTDNCMGFLDMISTSTIANTGGLYLQHVPLSGKLTLDFVVGVQADAFTCVIYPSRSGAIQPVQTNWQGVINTPNSVQKTIREFSGSSNSLTCYQNVAKEYGVNKNEVVNELVSYGGGRSSQPAELSNWQVCMQSDFYNTQAIGATWPTNVQGLAIYAKMSVWVRFVQRANEYLST